MKIAIMIIGITVMLKLTIQAQQMPGMQQSKMEMKTEQKAEIAKAVAVLSPAPGQNVHGLVTFVQTDKGVKIMADVSGLTPGKHGFHIHEFGDCSSPDFTSAGPHFMVSGETHGAPADSASHKGDLGNLEADAKGVAHLEWIDTHISLSGQNSIIGRAVVVHEKEDDLKSQPAGNAGARIACGTIGIAKP